MLPASSACALLVLLVVLHLSTAPSRFTLDVTGKLGNCADGGGEYSAPCEKFLPSRDNLSTLSILAEKDALSTTVRI